MSETDTSIFEEPKHVRVLRRLRLIKPEHRAQAIRRVILAVGIAWVPPAVLCLLRWLVTRDDTALNFFVDVAAYARFALAVPILILSEYIILPMLDATGRHFVTSKIIDPGDSARFEEAVASTRRLSLGVWPSATMTIIVYAAMAVIAVTIRPDALPVWHRSNGPLHLSLAGWWHLLVSVPLLMGLLLAWIWRVGVWARFLHCVSRMNLHLIASHPDKAAGLQFVSFSPRLFAPLAFAIGVITAGTFANEVLHLGINPTEHAGVPIGTAIVVVAIFICPPLVFARPLLMAWRRGVFEYGGLASRLGHQFEDKWLDPQSKVDTGSLAEPDFSSTTDLYSVVANVYSMRPVLFDPRSAIALAIATLVPFGPIWLTVIPAKTLLSQLLKLVI
ncbi:hypothetical protein [Dyella sp. C9]|uniref:hypothetical protein n=1 Tax=Dyella sp. C9 TaxID=2202154 RepID=UPI000DEF120C|nr:hypothetical protein [Dyella sp. C9]